MSRHLARTALLAVACSLVPVFESRAAEPAAATVEQPRAFGHVLGDVMTQRVLLQQAGLAVEPAALPAADRVGLWLERRAPRVEVDVQGRRWLAIDYQVINAPRALTAIALPAYTLATRAGAPLAVPAWPLSIGPLTPAAVFAQGELQPLRPDRAVAPLATVVVEQRLRDALVALAAVLLVWAAWWAGRGWREARRLPFARAWAEVRRHDEAQPEAWLAVHRALNETAGHVVHGGGLPRLLAAAPQLQPLRAQLEAFYGQSSTRFFGVDARAGDTAFPLRALSRALRDAERRHRR